MDYMRSLASETRGDGGWGRSTNLFFSLIFPVFPILPILPILHMCILYVLLALAHLSERNALIRIRAMTFATFGRGQARPGLGECDFTTVLVLVLWR